MFSSPDPTSEYEVKAHALAMAIMLTKNRFDTDKAGGYSAKEVYDVLRPFFVRRTGRSGPATPEDDLPPGPGARARLAVASRFLLASPVLSTPSDSKAAAGHTMGPANKSSMSP
jgi:hypothetical protein